MRNSEKARKIYIEGLERIDAEKSQNVPWAYWEGYYQSMTKILIDELARAESQIEFLEQKIEEGENIDRESENDAKGD